MRLYRRTSFAFGCAVLLLLLIWFGQGLTYNSDVLGYQRVPPHVPRCGLNNLTAAAELWRAIDEKYKDLREDKFTYAHSQASISGRDKANRAPTAALLFRHFTDQRSSSTH